MPLYKAASTSTTIANDTIWDAKGDIVVASAADTGARIAVGSDFQFLRSRAAATNGIEWAELASSLGEVLTTETTTSTSYTDLATSGPAVTLTTGSEALVIFGGQLTNASANGHAFMSYAVSGDTTIAASDEFCCFINNTAANQAFKLMVLHYCDGLTPGSNTFTAKYRCASGTGDFRRRQLFVIPL